MGERPGFGGWGVGEREEEEEEDVNPREPLRWVNSIINAETAGLFINRH